MPSRGLLPPWFATSALAPLLFTLAFAGCSSNDETLHPIAGSGGASSATTGTGGAGGGGSGGAGGGTTCTAPPRAFWTWDLSVMPPKDVQIQSTCRGETDHAYVYVADDVWDKDLDAASVQTILTAFEQATPANANKGIYAVDTDTFGEPPDVDGDPHVNLFYASMGSFQGFTFDGFFRSDDEGMGPHSNKTEMLHLNSSSSNAPDSDYMLAVVTHELVHLIEWRYDTEDEGWLHESLAEAGMVNAGYTTDLPFGEQYVKATATTPLCVSGYSDYGATFSWGTYMLDRFGPMFLQQVLQDPADGRVSIENHLPTGTTFHDAFGDFTTACLLDQPGIRDGRYGFSSIDEDALGNETNAVLDGMPHDTTTLAFGARMLRFAPLDGGTVSILLTSADTSKLIVHSAVFNPTNVGAATVALQDAMGPITLSLAAGQVADLVLAFDAGAAIVDPTQAPKSTITYTAALTP